MRSFRLSRYSVAVLLCSTLALYGAPGQFNQTTPYTTVFSRQLLRTSDAAAARTLLEVGAGGGGTGDVVGANTLTNQMPLLGVGSKSIIATNLPGFRAAVGLTIGTDVQAFDADLGTLSSGITGLVKGAGNGSGYSAAVSGTDYAPPTSGTSILKGNGLGGFDAAVAGTDYLTPTGLDTSAEFRTLLGDESGSGSMVFQGGNIAAATATTPTANDNTARVATTEYVQTELLDYQGLDADLNDLADGELTGSKVGAGINGNNITTGTVSSDRLPAVSLTQAGIVPAGTGNEGKILMVDDAGIPGYYFPDELPTGTLTVTTNMVLNFATASRLAVINGSKNLTNVATTGLVDGTGAAADATDVTGALGYTPLQSGGNIGAATATTPAANDNDTSVATTAYTQAELTDYGTDSVSLQNKDLTHSSNTLPAEIGAACSDETTALTAGTGKVTFRLPYAMTVTAVRASLTTAQTSGAILTVDINESGTSILSTKLTIDNTEKTSTTALTAAVISDSALADDAEITVDIDQIGDGTGKGLKIWLIGTR
jgi:hypothetical protein